MQVVTLIHETDKMSSIEIAELTGKQHAHIMRDIRALLSQGVAESNFGLGSYTDANGQERPLFNLTKKGCLILASGYDAKLREKIIDRWEELEMERKSKSAPEISRKELALMVVQAEEEKERLLLISEQQQATIEIQEEEIKKAAPKVNYYDTTLQSVNTLTTTQVAKEIGMEAFKLNKKLKECGVIYKQSGQWLFHAPYSNWGLHGTRTQTFTRSDGSTGTSIYTVFTQRGRRFIHALYDNEWDVKKAIKQIKDELTPGT